MIRKSIFFISLSLLLLTQAQSQTILSQPINSNWTFRQIGNTTWYPATVPGVVHLDLMANKIIPDPYFGANDEACQWVESADWQYTTNFSILNPQLLQKDVIEMVFEGLDTHALVQLNGEIILQAENMFRTYRVNVKPYLLASNNTMSIVFKSAVNHDNQMAALDFPMVIPSDNDRIYSRKAAYHYGWDWGPRLVTAGIWRPLYLEAWNNAKIESVYFMQQSVSNSSASINTQANIEVNITGSYTLKVINTETNAVYAQTTVQISQGEQNVSLPFTINNPTLWWPRGYGEQYLYPMALQLISNNQVIDQKSHNIGLRTVQLVQQNDTIGQSFYFIVNGVRIFAKGANYIPPDMFMPRVTKQVYVDTIEAAVQANFNFIRVWGGGTYENDTFYDICDKEGIMIWQEFMFADGMYPARPSQLENMEQEFIDNVKRLRNHACIVIWVGNNEIMEGWNNWDWQWGLTPAQLALISGWYTDIFLVLIPEVLGLYDGTRPYWPTSPEFGWAHEQSYEFGDSHFWGVWAGEEPIEMYTNHTGRFVSEYGMQGMLCMQNIKKFVNPSDLNFNSSAIKAHERHALGWPLLWMYMGYYKTITNFEHFVYGTQVMQKYALQTAIEAHRRNKPNTMGTLVWQLNDVWPAFSWATRDYYGTWKAPHYMMRKLYQDVVISFNQSQDNSTYDCWVINDKLFDFSANLTIVAMTLQGEILLNDTLKISVPADSSQAFYSIPINYIQQWNLNNTLIRGQIEFPFAPYSAENHYYFVRPIWLNLTQPTIKSQINILNQSITYTSDVFAIGMYLYTPTTALNVSDNYFDLLPGVPKNIQFFNITIKTLSLSYLTIWDAYDKKNEFELEETILSDFLHKKEKLTEINL